MTSKTVTADETTPSTDETVVSPAVNESALPANDVQPSPTNNESAEQPAPPLLRRDFIKQLNRKIKAYTNEGASQPTATEENLSPLTVEERKELIQRLTQKIIFLAEVTVRQDLIPTDGRLDINEVEAFTKKIKEANIFALTNAEAKKIIDELPNNIPALSTLYAEEVNKINTGIEEPSNTPQNNTAPNKIKTYRRKLVNGITQFSDEDLCKYNILLENKIDTLTEKEFLALENILENLFPEKWADTGPEPTVIIQTREPRIASLTIMESATLTKEASSTPHGFLNQAVTRAVTKVKKVAKNIPSLSPGETSQTAKSIVAEPKPEEILHPTEPTIAAPEPQETIPAATTEQTLFQRVITASADKTNRLLDAMKTIVTDESITTEKEQPSTPSHSGLFGTSARKKLTDSQKVIKAKLTGQNKKGLFDPDADIGYIAPSSTLKTVAK